MGRGGDPSGVAVHRMAESGPGHSAAAQERGHDHGNRIAAGRVDRARIKLGRPRLPPRAIQAGGERERDGSVALPTTSGVPRISRSRRFPCGPGERVREARHAAGGGGHAAQQAVGPGEQALSLRRFCQALVARVWMSPPSTTTTAATPRTIITRFHPASWPPHLDPIRPVVRRLTSTRRGAAVWR